MMRLAIAYIDSGGGHRAAAQALQEACRIQGRPWRIDLVNIDEVLEPVDPPYWLLRRRWSDVYNWILRHDLTYYSEFMVRFGHVVYQLLHRTQVALLRHTWRALRPDLVISVIPHLNRALFDSLMQELPGAQMVTVLTDFADVPPHFWIEAQPQHFICGTALATQQAQALAPRATVWPVSGMIVHPKFYDFIQVNRAEGRRKLGLDPHLPTGLVSFGGQGSKVMLRIAKSVAKTKLALQLIFLCGRKEELFWNLSSIHLPYPAHIQKFTDDVPHFLSLSDFFVGKPGPGSISEALVMRLPIIVKHGLTTMIQERYNIRWLEEMGVGASVKRIRDLPKVIQATLQPETYRAMRCRIDTLNNQAVFEIPNVLNSIMQRLEPAKAVTRPPQQERQIGEQAGQNRQNCR
jgi:UDP-N-acetylglucosamine:LPS N-acetylglucosamine transferase